MVLTKDDIREIIPHRHEMLLLDKILDVKSGETIVAVKKVSSDDFFFRGHFPDFPIMPGVLQVEAIAQAAAVAGMSMPGMAGKIPVFARIDSARFRHPVLPGDELRLEVELTSLRETSGRASGKAFVRDKLVSEADIMFMIGERP